ncbi:uncharacterized protein LOC111696803 isoform X3 [Eurytemora carolleeae]|uniref:uncharacterized protein LOC111696803 isoform X3 n=1 Tax=Eurytemora carolleeae TaxID=1294199 RepID=UPI000C783CD6|nr:uncharacterized protein LOC111696803 isoform X3 [Eurytemora carolleeae]|eukprot:XP_023322315.1 uncharacterized protein LOC111696803 isoform X3 [Eurytemora affinis]
MTRIVSQPGEEISKLKRTAILFAVKPLTVIYFMIWAVTNTVNTQLWEEKVCKITLNFTDEVCNALTDPRFQQENDQVQKTVNLYQIYDSYFESIPQALIALYLGPLSGYIGDVTKVEERTALMSILSGLSFIMVPLADFCGVQLYTYFGYFATYGTSLGFVILGIIYLQFIPESVNKGKSEIDKEIINEDDKKENWFKKLLKHIQSTNSVLSSTFKSIFKEREGGERELILLILGLGLIGSIRAKSSGLLYTQKKFGWSVTDYSYYTMFMVVHLAVKSLFILPILCYCFQVHDCMLGLLGYMSSIEEFLVFAFATKGWMMYYGSALSALGGSRSTPESALLTKCVPTSEIGKVYTLYSFFQTLISLVMSSSMQLVYNATIETFLGATYCIAAGQSFIGMLGMIYLYRKVITNERKNGPLGTRGKEE